MTRVTGDAPMARLLRENYWFPFTLSEGLKPDGKPERVRLLGENYVAFRATDGRVGFFLEGCPHRGASLALARNEDNALRCIFHGWKYSVDGRCVEAPTQHEHHDEFCRTVPLRAHPVREAAGLVWVWLGEGPPQRFPDFEFTKLDGDRVRSTRQVLKFNWVQSLEGLVDSAHVSILHSDWLEKADPTGRSSLASAGLDTAPVYEIEDKPGGFRYAAIRRAGAASNYIRVTEFTAPWYCFIPFSTGNCVISVPIDDENTFLFFVMYNVDGPVPASAYGPTATPMDFPPYLRAGPEDHWGQDRDIMMRGSFSGFREHLMHEDFAVAESQGRIADRSREFLNPGDRAIMHLRRLLLDTVKGFASGQQPSVIRHEAIPYPTIRAAAEVLPNSTEWRSHFV